MAERQRISLRTEPHVIELDGLPEHPGEVLELSFKPEVDGDEFLDAYGALQDTIKEAGLTGKVDGMDVDPEAIKTARVANREFLATFMLPHTVELFATFRLPDKAMGELTDAVVGFYTPGRPTGSSNGSAPASSKAGRRSTAPSRSKASTRAGGRSKGS